MQLAMPRASPRRLRGRHERPLFCLAEAEQGWALLWQRQKKAHRDPRTQDRRVPSDPVLEWVISGGPKNKQLPLTLLILTFDS